MIEQSLPRLLGKDNLEPWSRQLIDDLNVRLRALTQARVTNADSQYGYLSSKIVAGANVSLAVLNTGGDEKLEISAGGGGGSVTNITQGTGVKLTPNPLTTTGTVDLDIPSLSPSTPSQVDLFPFQDVSVHATNPSAQRQATLLAMQNAMDLVNLGNRAHSSLTGIGANDHHNQSHVLATNLALGVDHTISGATLGHVLRASGATTALFAQLLHADLGAVGANDHHAQSHVLATTAGLGADHTTSGLTVGQVLRASGAAAAAFAALNYTDLAGSVPAHAHSIHTDLTADDHSIYLLLAGRTGTTNDPVISTGATGSIYGSSTNTTGILRLFSNNKATPSTVDVMHQARLIPSSLTFTVAATNLLDVGTGGLVLNGVTSLRVVNFTPTITVSANMTATSHLFRHNATWNLGAAVDQLGVIQTFSAVPIITPNSGLSLAAMTLRGLAAAPTLNNSGSDNVGLVQGMFIGGTLNASWLLTDWAGIRFDEPTGGNVSLIDRMGFAEIGDITRTTVTSKYSIWSKGAAVPFCHSGPGRFGGTQTTPTGPTGGSIFQADGGVTYKRRTVANADTTAALDDFLINITGVSADRTVTLPTVASALAGKMYIITNDDGSCTALLEIIVDGNGAETIDGSATAHMRGPAANIYSSITLICTGTAWKILATTGTVTMV